MLTNGEHARTLTANAIFRGCCASWSSPWIGSRSPLLAVAASSQIKRTLYRIEDGNMTRKILRLSTTVVGMLALFFSVPLTAQNNSSQPTVNHAVASGISAPLRD